LLINKIHS